ncbi:NAD(P)-dependent oxidoreductase [Aestuariirhabdus litorea]|uniref:NAD(P)-dependent oxidoreductase n=2 Tax=Aestuariirhabdus litorea TaxID=2528527 RepID=A0A3P3VLB8_9GAMM|nr:NAD(P)-dependent oxidoreductase [Aestuariirhabdus litorea]RWW96773.1 NAD(P)-dependent oxidoreductase [Endozoicomonadaceae bacterium GTF-13]
MEKLGFIGIGLMGAEMVPRFLDAGYEVFIWNRTVEKMAPLAQRGARPCASIAELVESADILLLCLGDTAAVESVVFGSGGISSQGRPSQLLLDLSSIDPGKTRQFAADLKASAGVAWVDCPVSGGVVGARQGSLAIMAGGEEAVIERARPILECVGQRLTRMGPVGSGQLTKVCNQMIVGCNAMVIAEMIALAQRGGVDAEKIPQALAGGFADSRPLQILGPQMATHCFEPVAWHVRTLLKDLDTALQVSREANSPVPMSAAAAQLMRVHASRGNGERDPSTLIQLYCEAE